jgi:DNA gyrase/topoisomerase IV subunit A
LIRPEQIEEWLQEVEQRPSSAGLIIRYITNRLKDLTARNEELLAENIALRSGRKVEEFEGKIANLEYQVEVLKRQLGGVINGTISAIPAAVETISLLVYTVKGHVVRASLPVDRFTSGEELTAFTDQHGKDGPPPRILMAGSQEELLFVFDSGRSTTMPLTEIPEQAADQLDWSSAYRVEPRAGEELAAVLAIGRMTLHEYILQVSRRGCAKKMMRSAFEQHLAKNYIGTGIRSQPDKTCGLALSGRDERVVLASREGWLATVEVGHLPYTSEEVLKLSATDYVISAFTEAQKPSVVIVTDTGKVIHRECGWLEPTESFKSRGQAVFSQSRREAGTRVVGAAAVEPNDWGAALLSDGRIVTSRMEDLFAAGSFRDAGSLPDADPSVSVVDFTAFALSGKGA